MIAEYGDFRGFDALCPDGDCVIFEGDQQSRYLLDLDGTPTPLPFGQVTGTFAVP